MTDASDRRGLTPELSDEERIAKVFTRAAEALDLIQDPLTDIAERLRADLATVRATLKQRRQDKDDLFAELRLLVKAEEVLVSALRPFDRKRKKG